jgi:hypothetical protein
LVFTLAVFKLSAINPLELGAVGIVVLASWAGVHDCRPRFCLGFSAEVERCGRFRGSSGDVP